MWISWAHQWTVVNITPPLDGRLTSKERTEWAQRINNSNTPRRALVGLGLRHISRAAKEKLTLGSNAIRRIEEYSRALLYSRLCQWLTVWPWARPFTLLCRLLFICLCKVFWDLWLMLHENYVQLMVKQSSLWGCSFGTFHKHTHAWYCSRG